MNNKLKYLCHRACDLVQEINETRTRLEPENIKIETCIELIDNLRDLKQELKEVENKIILSIEHDLYYVRED